MKIKPDDVFGDWTVLSYAGVDKNRNGRWLCACECGTVKVVYTHHLTSGRSQGCGCTKVVHGLTGTAEYQAWKNMRKRCYNQENPRYPDYGGRGIKICDRWLNDPAAFLEDMGERPSPDHSIDRRDNDGDYEPSNCRWATRSEQQRNKRRK